MGHRHHLESVFIKYPHKTINQHPVVLSMRHNLWEIYGLMDPTNMLQQSIKSVPYYYPPPEGCGRLVLNGVLVLHKYELCDNSYQIDKEKNPKKRKTSPFIARIFFLKRFLLVN